MSFLAAIGIGHTFTGTDGKKYTLSPLSFKELGEFVLWVQYKPYRDAKAALLPDDICKEILEECKLGKVKEQSVSREWFEANKDNPEAIPEEGDFEEREFSIGLDSTVVKKEMLTGEGLHHLMVLSLSVRHPEFKTKPINHIINLPKFKELTNLLLVINGLAPDDDEDDEDDEEAEKNETGPNTTSR